MPTFRNEIDRANIFLKQLEDTYRVRFTEINNGIDKISKSMPTSEEIHQKLTKEQSNLATKTQVSEIRIELANSTKDISKEIGEIKGKISAEVGQIKGKLSSNFVTVMSGIVLTLVTLFGKIVTVFTTISNSIDKHREPKVLQSKQLLPAK